jgi:type VI secretion system protein ImpK
LDLLARVHAQEGRYQQAESLWTRAVELAPTHDVYRKALERVRRIRTNKISRMLAAPWLALSSRVTVVVAVLATAGTLVLRTAVREEPRGVAATDAATPPSSAVWPPEMDRDLSGFTRRNEGNEISFVPDSGLFASGSAALTPRARALLSSLGQHLEPYRDSIDLHVEGYTDDLPTVQRGRFKDNASLGMARAVAVYDQLRSTTRLLPARLFASSHGDSARPFAGTDPSARRRNRTVVLRVARRQ